MLLLLFFAFLVFLTIGMDIAVAMGAASLIYLLVSQFLGSPLPLTIIPQKLMDGLDSFPYLAIPLFILAGELMNQGGITKRLIKFCNAVVGHFVGGLAHVSILVNVIMSGMSGSAVADCAATGVILIPELVKAKYSRSFATGLLAAAATIGPIIPPSIPFVIYGSICNVSVGRMFLGGVIPGLLMGLSLMVIVYFMGIKYKFPREKRATRTELYSSLKDAALALLLPVFIVLGIITGATTPTEAAVVGVLYAAGLGVFVYREINFQILRGILIEASIVSGAVMITISTAQLMSFLLALENINQLMTTALTTISSNPLVILLLINIILFLLGCVLEPIPILLVMVPILYPFIVRIGVDPIHFGVMITLNLMIGLLTPPVGMNLFIVAAIGNIPVMDVFKGQLPFMLVLLLVLLIIMCFPPIVTWFPNLIMR